MNITAGQSLSHYHILERLGEGGMAVVFKAFDTRLERNVAIKVIRVDQFAPATIGHMLQRFEREAKALGRLTHPNIVHVNDYGEQDGTPFIVMDYLPGGTLKQFLGQPIPWQDAAKLLLPIARALQYAHDQGIIHRDVKPSNILVTRSGEPMLSDFGIAKILETDETTSLTKTGASPGTPEYMAPEQWTGNVSGQSDIYSLGVIFYEMITGRKPYMADTPAAILLKQATEPLPRPTLSVPDLPDAIEKVLIKALANKTENRYQNMAEFVSAMERLLGGLRDPQYSARFTKPAESKANPTIDPQKTGLQESTWDTRLQKTTRDEIPQRQPPPLHPSRSISTNNPQPDKPKSRWWIWLLGLSGTGCIFLAGLVIIPLMWPKRAPTPAPIVDNPTYQALPAATSAPIIIPPDVPTYTTASTYTFLPTYTDMPTYTPVPTDTQVFNSQPRMFNFQACLEPCNGSNGLSSFPEKVTRIYLQWQYENIPAGAHFVRISSLGGNEWAKYDCTWPHPSTGTDSVKFTEPAGIHSGDWNLSIYINNELLLNETIHVEGSWDYWDPAGLFTKCYGTS